MTPTRRTPLPPVLARTTALVLGAAITLTALPSSGAEPTGADHHDWSHRAVHARVDHWFTDPLTADERAAEVRVPRHPLRLDGSPLRATTARLRTHSGRLAVPVAQATGHRLRPGQAVTVGDAFTFNAARLTATARRQLHALGAALPDGATVRCEGNTDYRRLSESALALSLQRAERACSLLRADDPTLTTRSAGFGYTIPVVVGGRSTPAHDQRAANRRVVVAVTAVRVAPGVPRAFSAKAGDSTATLTFRRPASAGSSPVTGYQYSFDGETWTRLTTTGTARLTGTVTGLTNGQAYLVGVRAVSAHGAGAYAGPLFVLPSRAPGAPTLTRVVPGYESMYLVFAAPAERGTPELNGYQVTQDGGLTWQDLATSGSGPFRGRVTGLSNGTTYRFAVRATAPAVDASGPRRGAPSQVLPGAPSESPPPAPVVP